MFKENSVLDGRRLSNQLTSDKEAAASSYEAGGFV